MKTKLIVISLIAAIIIYVNYSIDKGQTLAEYGQVEIKSLGNDYFQKDIRYRVDFGEPIKNAFAIEAFNTSAVIHLEGQDGSKSVNGNKKVIQEDDLYVLVTLKQASSKVHMSLSSTIKNKK